ncbi:dihydroorotase [Thermanaerovibrio acidaminovorans]|jgi:dihydroorotase|uniref:Dihydroorotase n=1 Tax=Thermanaerovibrio acidaminovorans (strain ATCC 49978 / DSM 6589 / Su883) TaxID=525903 RepID=D1B5N2_THEAS|nr:dihydroorotase [Thermanaerovibrio acidaminovorans]ACZ19323.1 dihydroorotase, multifunctional complex type [Thermanaerovibrio acidaminovorans DSM 6589]
MDFVIKGVRVFSGGSISEELWNVGVQGGRVAMVSRELPQGLDAPSYDGQGGVLVAGMVDIHCHLREPGFEWREDLRSGSAAGAAGGFTCLVAMPNTDPPVDVPSGVEHLALKGSSLEGARVVPAGCVSKGRRGEEMAELLKMVEAGAVLFTDDGAPVRSSSLLRLALMYLRGTGVRVMEHPEDTSLSKGGQVHEGRISALSGLKGIPSASEDLAVMRAIELARETRGAVHLTHLSSKRSVDLVRRAKAEGVDVTCDVTAHHLTFCEEDVMVSGYSGAFKVNPPLRSQEDREALWAALADGTVDAIATDHAPWHLDEKDLPFQEASFGIASLECAVPAVIDGALKRGVRLERVLDALSVSPRRIASLPPVAIREGDPADMTLLDLQMVARVDCRSWRSKCRFSPFDGAVLKGWPVMTVVGGRLSWEAQDR